MSKQEERKQAGGPECAFKLSQDLSKTLRKSEAFNSASNDSSFTFDIMAGIANFTAGILKALDLSLNPSKSICDYYIEEMLPRAFKEIDKTLDRVKAAIEEVEGNNIAS